jgi:hypothetical protein
MGGELLIHTWDLGQAIGISMRFDEAIAQSIYDEVKDKTDAMQKSGFYGPPKDVPTDANIEIRLLAVFGRSPNIWREEQST